MAEEETNFYNPEDGQESDKPSDTKGSKNTSVSWTASEFIEHDIGFSWYLILLLATAAIAALIYFVTHDYFAVGITAILGVIVAFYAGHKPSQVEYQVNSQGVKAGERSYNYKNFKSFSVIHEGALSTITFYPLKRLAIPLSIFFDPKDEGKITNIIGDHLPLENRGPDYFDRLTRRLKL